MIFKKITASSIITKSNLPDADYVINPYVGCTHACIYCYARFMKRFTGHKEEWGQFSDIKINAAALIPHDSKKYQKKKIFLSSVTDPYLALEAKYQLTRQILQALLALQPELGILTKSDLVVRDLDILKGFTNCEIGFTITTCDDALRKEIEPRASSITARINALREIKKDGLKNYVFISPILPYLTDWREIIRQTKDFTERYMFENLNVAGTVWQQIKTWLAAKHPDLLTKYGEIYNGRSCYWQEIEQEIIQFCKKEKIDNKIYFHHKRKVQ